MPETKRKLEVWEKGDKGWEKVDASINGSYMVFSMVGNTGTFKITEKEFSWAIVLMISMIIIIGLGIKIFALLYKKYLLHYKAIS